MNYDIHAEVHKKVEFKNKKNQEVVAYRVKVSMLSSDIGMYINGNMVYTPNAENQDWSVQTPKAFNSKAKIVEFDGKSPLWKEYKQACIDSVQEYMRLETLDNSKDKDLYEKSDEDFKKQMIEDMEKLGF